MRKHDANLQQKRQRKANELDAVYEYLQNNVATATMTATALNIYRPSLCRRKRTLEKAGLLVEVKNAYCKVTKCKAAYLTTNPQWFPIQSQLKFNF
jgi:Mn-dependent DtxR family transcriptional regulator